MIYYPIVVLLFLLNFFVDAEPTYSKYPKVMNINIYVASLYIKYFNFISHIDMYRSKSHVRKYKLLSHRESFSRGSIQWHGKVSGSLWR